MAVGVWSGANSGGVNYGHPLAEVWHGTNWSITTVPTSSSADLGGVSCLSATWCMAVGDIASTRSRAVAYAIVWDGSNWSPVSVPASAIGHDYLGSVSCLSRMWCMAVGSSGAGTGGVSAGLVAAWNGSKWKLVAELGHVKPSPGQVLSPDQVVWLTTVSCPSTKWCLASEGRGRVPSRFFVWTGGRWAPVSDSNPPIGVSCLSQTFCMGTEGEWNGKNWKPVPVPPVSDGGGYLLSISCVSSVQCMGVGEDEPAGLIDEWKGSQWSLMPNNEPANWSYTVLQGVSCASSLFCAAVGGEGDEAAAEVYR